MTIHFRRAVASEAKPLVGLYGESGSGKTKSALLLAKGFVGDMSRVAMIETESGRGEAYADDPVVGGYNVLSLREEFSPKTYGAAIAAAEKAGFECIVVDSASHEWEGVGGVLAMAAAKQATGAKGPLVWQQPKIDHQREFMLRLTQTPIPLVVVCMRAKYPMYQVKPADVERWKAAGRPGNEPKPGDWARSWTLEPKQSDDILFEMFIHGWIDREAHRFHGTKYTVDTLRPVFVDGEPISVDTGRRLAAWASKTKAPAVDKVADSQGSPGDKSADSQSAPSSFISAKQAADLEAYCLEHRVPLAGLLAAAGKPGPPVPSVDRLPSFERAKAYVDKQIAARTAEANEAAARG